MGEGNRKETRERKGRNTGEGVALARDYREEKKRKKRLRAAATSVDLLAARGSPLLELADGGGLVGDVHVGGLRHQRVVLAVQLHELVGHRVLDKVFHVVEHVAGVELQSASATQHEHVESRRWRETERKHEHKHTQTHTHT